MPQITLKETITRKIDIPLDMLVEVIDAHGLVKKWHKAKALFESNPSLASLNTELLEPKHRAIYSFRLDKRYRALFIHL